ncbi:MAG: heme lyase CcmF/NrfE family subunit [Solirubrobacterales bacterium]
MNALGAACLLAAIGAAVFTTGAAVHAARSHDRRWAQASRRALYALAGLLTVAVVAVELAFYRDDFSLAVVANHSSLTTPVFYKLTAMWSSQEGSLLLCAWLLSVVASIAVVVNHRRHRELVPWATAVFGVLSGFFVILMVTRAMPFTTLPQVPPDGAGLNPLLRHPSMMIHPPMLYSGYVWFSVPFAFAVAALITRRLDASWIAPTRRFTLVAWTFLTLGILLGARWSYTELGWGGYWAWDPVENASLMPWLIGTAFLHSVMVQEKRGMLKVWNVSLIAATFTLSLLGTFLVRSGVLQSIHAFGESTVGTPLLVLIATVILGSAVLIVTRLPDLRTERRIDSLLSRESIFLANNLLLVGLTLVVFWGTFFPLIAEAFTGKTSSLAAPWFDRYTVPLALLLVLFTGIGPIVAWRKVTVASVRSNFLLPAAVAGAVATVAMVVGGAGREPVALLLFALAGFTAAALAQELVRGTQARRALSNEGAVRAFGSMVGRNRRRYGGYVVHLGIAVLFVGVAASSSFQTNRDVQLRPGQSAEIGAYDVRYERPTVDLTAERIALGARMQVSRDGVPVGTLDTARNYYPASNPFETGFFGRFFEGEATTEVGLQAGLGRDLWIASQPDITGIIDEARAADKRLTSLPRAQIASFMSRPELAERIRGDLAARYTAADAPPVTFRAIVNPMVSWLWIGALIGLAGAILAVWPTGSSRTRRASSLEAARRLRRDLDFAQ